MATNNRLQLDPAPGDIFVIHYRASTGLSSEERGTQYLKEYFRDSQNFKLLEVQKDNENYIVRLKTVTELGEANKLYNLPKMNFIKLRESKSVFSRFLNVIVGFFVGR